MPPRFTDTAEAAAAAAEETEKYFILPPQTHTTNLEKKHFLKKTSTYKKYSLYIVDSKMVYLYSQKADTK